MLRVLGFKGCVLEPLFPRRANDFGATTNIESTRDELSRFLVIEFLFLCFRIEANGSSPLSKESTQTYPSLEIKESVIKTILPKFRMVDRRCVFAGPRARKGRQDRAFRRAVTGLKGNICVSICSVDSTAAGRRRKGRPRANGRLSANSCPARGIYASRRVRDKSSE